MKKCKISTLILAIALLVGVTLAVTLTASAAVSDSSFSASGLGMNLCGEGCDHENCYDYSFAVVGDTQCLNYYSDFTQVYNDSGSLTSIVDNGNNYMNGLYQWILDNEKGKNIQYVMGLGDIVQSFNTSQIGHDQEWVHAKTAIEKLNGAIGYSLVRGNHDVSAPLNATFNSESQYYKDLVALSKESDANGPMAGIFKEGCIEDTFRKININGDKFIIFTLDWQPTADCVIWVDDILAANADYRAIITIHQFLTKDGSIVDDPESTFPHEQVGDSSWGQVGMEGGVFPRVLWDNVLSKHANVEFILCGHEDIDNIVTTQMRGVNGNTVTSMIIDPQGIDYDLSGAENKLNTDNGVGMVAMFYFKNGGDVVNVEYISTVRANRGDNAYLNGNQFAVTYNYGTDDTDGWTSTPYGYLPTDEYNDNIFHLFSDDDGIDTTERLYVGSFNTWPEAVTRIVNYYNYGSATVRSTKTLTAYMSEDYNGTSDAQPSNNLGKIPGSVELDLGGHTYTTGSKIVLPWYNNAAVNSYHGRFTFKNGSFDMSGGNALAALNQVNNTGKLLSLTLDGVKFHNVKAPVITTYGGDAAYKGAVNVNVNDCTFDMSAATATAKVTLFNFANAYDNNDVTVKINGGSIVSATSANTVIYALTDSDTVVFGEGEDGKYMTVSLNENVAPVGAFKNESGELLTFTTSSTSAPYLYTMKASSVEKTVYGDIPTDTYPMSGYPIALFVKDASSATGYRLEKCFDTYYGFLTYLKASAPSTEAVLYLRADWNTNNDAKVNNNDRNLNCIKAKLTIDLNGKTFTRGTQHLFQVMIPATDKSYDITVKNGTICSASTMPPMPVNRTGTDTTAVSWAYTFENVTFTTTKDYAKSVLVASYSGSANHVGANVTMTFNGCTFDFTNLTSAAIVFAMQDLEDVNKNHINVIINGGEIKGGAFDYTFATYNDGYDTVKFGQYNGNYTKFILDNGTGAPDIDLVSLGGEELVLVSESSSNSSVYRVAEKADIPEEPEEDLSITTPYGKIPAEYADANAYKVVIFLGDKTFAGAYADWNSTSLTAMKNNCSTASSIVNMIVRSDIVIPKDFDGTYWSNSHGTINIDLCGNTITTSSNKPLFKPNNITATAVTSINVSNGEILLAGSSSSLIYYSSGNAAADGTVYNMSFTNVRIGYAAGATTTSIVKGMGGTAGIVTSATYTFTDCDIDMQTNAPAKAITLFGLASANKNHAATVIIDGGTLRLGREDFVLATLHTDTAVDSITFTNTSGVYTKIIAPDAITLPAGVATANGGNLVAVEIANDGTDATYRLTPKAVADQSFVPKASITLGSELTFNIYVPANGNLTALTLNGENIDLSALTAEEGYYLISEALGAREAAKTLTLVATLTVDGKVMRGSFTFSIPKYAEKLLTDVSASAEEKALVKDVLSYIKAAYAYFGTTDAEALAKIDELLGENYDESSAPVMNGSAEKPTLGITTVTYDLTAKPALRFYLAEGFKASDFVFSIKGNTVSAEEGSDANGKYVEVKLYAYELAETVDYTVNGESDSCHIQCYYEWAKTQNNDNLVKLVERFAKYCESAKAYRESVIN